MKKRIQFGVPGHFIAADSCRFHLLAADSCRFHLHTHVGKWCISTVGEYFPGKGEKMEEVGYKRLYETMVFNARSKRERWREMDFGAYNTRSEAENGHEALCAKYEALS